MKDREALKCELANAWEKCKHGYIFSVIADFVLEHYEPKDKQGHINIAVVNDKGKAIIYANGEKEYELNEGETFSKWYPNKPKEEVERLKEIERDWNLKNDTSWQDEYFKPTDSPQKDKVSCEHDTWGKMTDKNGQEYIGCYGCGEMMPPKPSPSAEFKTKLPLKVNDEKWTMNEIVYTINEILDYLKEVR